MTRDKNDMLDALAKPFPPQAIKQRRGSGGRMWDYVPGDLVIRRLNDATGGQWDFRIASMDWRNDLVVVVGELTIPGLGTRAGIGVQRVADNSGEDIIKGAQTDSLKKAATQFGVALDLYGPDVEAGEVDDRAVSQRPAPRNDAPQRSQDAPGRAEPAVDLSEVMRRLHAALRDHSITHEDVHAYYATKGFASVGDVPQGTLERMAAWAKREDTETVQGEFARVLAPAAQPALVTAAVVPEGEAAADRWTD